MMRLRVQNLIGKDVNEITQSTFYTENGFYRHTDAYRKNGTDGEANTGGGGGGGGASYTGGNGGSGVVIIRSAR